MDYEEYQGLRCTDVPMCKEDVEKIIETSDARVLSLLIGDLKTGKINYINLELSNKAAERLLDISSVKGMRARAYGHLIDYELSHGRQYRELFEKAVDEGIEPEFPLYKNETDKALIKRMTKCKSDGFDTILKKMEDGSPQRHIVADPELMADALRILGDLDYKTQAESIVRLSPYYAGKECDDRMKQILTEALGHVEYGQFDQDLQFDINQTIESLYGINEHDWLIQSAINGNNDAIEELNWRMPSIESERREQYIDAYKEIIRKGWMIRWNEHPYLYSVDVLPRELLDYAIDCCENPRFGDDGEPDCRRCSAYELAAEITKRCFISGQYEDAYRYALKSERDEFYPLVYTMLMDGLGVEKNEELAKNVLPRFS